MKRKSEDPNYVSFLSDWHESFAFERWKNVFWIQQNFLTKEFENFVKVELQDGGFLKLDQFTFGSFFSNLETKVQENEEKYAFKGYICLYLLKNKRGEDMLLQWSNQHSIKIGGNYIPNETSEQKEDSPHIIPLTRGDKGYRLNRSIYIKLEDDGQIKFHHRNSSLGYEDLQISFKFIKPRGWGPCPFQKYRKMSSILVAMQSLKEVLVKDVLQMIAVFVEMLVPRAKMYGFWKSNLTKLSDEEYKRNSWKKTK
jgi:hypothetical protein